MSMSKNRRIKARRKLNRKLKYIKESETLNKEIKQNLHGSFSKPKKFPDYIYNKPKKKNKGLVEKFKSLFKRKIRK